MGAHNFLPANAMTTTKDRCVKRTWQPHSLMQPQPTPRTSAQQSHHLQPQRTGGQQVVKAHAGRELPVAPY